MLFTGVIRDLLTDAAVLGAATSALDTMYSAAYESGTAGVFSGWGADRLAHLRWRVWGRTPAGTDKCDMWLIGSADARWGSGDPQL